MILRKPKYFISLPLTGLSLYPVMSFAQEVKLADDSSSVTDIFLKVAHWGLLLLVLIGIIMMPISGYLWYRKNRADHQWIDYFKSGSFALRTIIIVIALMIWYFKIVDRVFHIFL